MGIPETVVIAILSAVLGLLVKIIFDWLKNGKNGGNGTYTHLAHDNQLKHNVEEMALLRRIFDNVVENQVLLRDILDKLKRRGKQP